jgi:hypothetical protein
MSWRGNYVLHAQEGHSRFFLGGGPRRAACCFVFQSFVCRAGSEKVFLRAGAAYLKEEGRCDSYGPAL